MKITTREIVESGMLIALAIILDLPFLKFRVGENGGSISFTMVPLFILALRVGPLKGFIGCGIVYGVITCLTDGWGFMYFPFDYLLGYGSIAIAGFFKNRIFKASTTFKGIMWSTLAVVLALIGRIISSSISSMVFYEFKLIPALIYNITYIIPSGVLTIDLIAVLYKPLLKINERHPLRSI